jgi:hypothetical protein
VEVEDESSSLDDRVRSALESFVPRGKRSSQSSNDELAILKRWYYRSHKAGELIRASEEGELPVRKLGNAIRRVYKGERPEPASSA